MELKDILAVSGQPGLFKYVAKSTNGIIVESLTDGRRTNFSAASRVSALAEIAIFTDTEELPLWRVFDALWKNTGGRPSIDPKSSPDALRAKMAEIAPEYDRERVHVSDMKKLFAWYNALVAAGMTDFTIKEEEEQTEGEAQKEAAAE
ncbi:MAG: DUF5606 domain-containing protein [Rikenellaceae bacterium]|nr:DUF5606 domain-containing protein [Rikenellaceae bacterium]MCL2692514.1 DUF5606 domain-containing protein [Rikenellaceae bacterium]